MRIMLLTSAHNGLSQRVMVELQGLGHDIVVEVVMPGLDIDARVREHDPELVVCPFLTARIPEETWRDYCCLIVHPGIVGDRGPSSLDWAIVGGEERWGVTVLQAAEDFDAGDIWATNEFALRPARKSGVYRHEVTEAAVRGVLQAVDRAGDPAFRPVPLDERDPQVRGRVRPPMRQSDRAIDWSTATSAEVIAKIWAADGRPGVADELLDRPVRLFGAHAEGALRGEPGALLAQRDGAVCRATVDGAVWITHLCAVKETGCLDVKLPATAVLGAAVDGLPVSAPSLSPAGHATWQELTYDEQDGVGHLSFDCNNGAVGTDQAQRLLGAVRHALARPTRVLVLHGGVDFFCNGIHLGLAEAAVDPGRTSLENLKALNAVAREILTATDKLTISALRGDAAAGGVMVALAADVVLARAGVMLNPHYNAMGLYGSEYWTYVLPRRVGVERAAVIARECRPVVAHQAARERLIDSAEGTTLELFGAHVARRARALADDPHYEQRLEEKRRRRAADEARRPLADHEAAELERMERCVLPPDAYYHVARRCFFAGMPAPPRPLVGPFAVDEAELGPAGGRLAEASVA